MKITEHWAGETSSKHIGTMPEMDISYWRQQGSRDLSNRLPMAIRCNRTDIILLHQPNLVDTNFK